MQDGGHTETGKHGNREGVSKYNYHFDNLTV